MARPTQPVPHHGIVYATPGELFGKESSLEEVRQHFSGVSRSAMTTLLCRLGVTFSPASPGTAVERDRSLLRPLLLPPAVRELVDAFDSEHRPPDAGVAFCRPQILLALRLAQHFCPDFDQPTLSTQTLQKIGLALIHVSSLLVDGRDTKEERPEDGVAAKKHVAAMMMSLFEVSNPPTSVHSLRRTFEMTRSPRWEQDPVLVEAGKAFRAQVGLTITEYFSVVAGLVSKFTTDPHPGRVIEVLMAEALKKAPSRDGIRNALDRISLPYEALPSHTPAPEEAIHDASIRPFRARPLIALPEERYLCTDATFLSMLITTGLFWSVREMLPPPQQKALFPAWGLLFEDYVHDSLEPCFPEGTYIRSPVDRDDQEITDALVDYGSDVVLVEVKAVLVRDELKYGRDLDKILALLEERLLKKGQIVRALTRLFDRRSGANEAERLLKGRFVERVYPVIVTYEHALCGPFIAEFLNERLQQQVREAGLPKHPVVKPLTLIAADDVDLLEPLLRHGIKLSRMLKEFTDFGRADVSFHNYLFDIARKAGKPFQAGSEHTRFLDECLTFWKAQGLPEGTTW